MGAHILLVSKENFEVCIDKGVYGCVKPLKEWNRGEIVAGVLSIQPGDLIFFYVKNVGIYGLWKAAGQAYFDETKIWANDEQLYPYRFSFEPTVGAFQKPIVLNDILDLHDKGRIWTFDLNPVQQKNQYKITMDEARELIRLLLRNNPIRKAPTPIAHPYSPQNHNAINIDFSSLEGNHLRYESWLNAWFVRSFEQGRLKTLLGDYQEFINLVPTTFNKVMDIFLTHVTNVDGIEILHKYTCIELKADKADEQDLTQVLRYEDWISRKLAAGDHEMVQSVLVASKFTEGLLGYIKSRQRIEEKTVRLITYRVLESGEDILLEEIT
jgi:hypothetical protein